MKKPEYNEENRQKLAHHIVNFGMTEEDVKVFAADQIEQFYERDEEAFFIEWEEQLGDKPE